MENLQFALLIEATPFLLALVIIGRCKRRLLCSVFLSLLISCTSSPLNRRQVVIFSEAEMVQQGEHLYRRIQQEEEISTDSRNAQYVRCVADHIIAALDESQRTNYLWEITVFNSEQANAFALPGGKIGVYSGLLGVAQNQHQLAAVMAHEVGHVLANHSNERASQSTIRNIGVAAAQTLGISNSALEALDLGAQLGLFLPFNRIQESEADSLGVILMANAGFDPMESITLWQNMNAASGSRSPELLSTHPSPRSRMAELRSLMSAALQLRQTAISKGLNPNCLT
ncbi:MAG: M48 family metallopeptidase [Gammaproteobacteria bacterium]|nr:M48 family metallopeptidase [Gammaproteobacteria bacterium]